MPFTYVAPFFTVLDSPRISEYRTIRKGICNKDGRQAPNGLVPFSLYSFIISWLSSSRFSGPLYLVCSFFISGCSRCMAIIDLVLLTVTGVSASMMSTVNPMMERP
jgi:hypothetical protein